VKGTALHITSTNWFHAFAVQSAAQHSTYQKCKTVAEVTYLHIMYSFHCNSNNLYLHITTVYRELQMPIIHWCIYSTHFNSCDVFIYKRKLLNSKTASRLAIIRRDQWTQTWGECTQTKAYYWIAFINGI